MRETEGVEARSETGRTVHRRHPGAVCCCRLPPWPQQLFISGCQVGSAVCSIMSAQRPTRREAQGGGGPTEVLCWRMDYEEHWRIIS